MYKIFFKYDYYVSIIKIYYLINDYLLIINLINFFYKFLIVFDKISNKKVMFGYLVLV